MIAICAHNRMADIPNEYWVGGNGTSIVYLTIGESYEVYGQAIIGTAFCFLVKDDTGHPAFVEVPMFEELSQPIPTDWRFALREGIGLTGRDLFGQVQAVWGYEELVDTKTHVSGLIAGNNEDRQIFVKEEMRREERERNAEWDETE